MGCCPLLKGTKAGLDVGYTEETAVFESSLRNVRVPSNMSSIDLFLPCPPRGCTQSSSVWAFKGMLVGRGVTGRHRNLVLILTLPRAPHRAGLFLGSPIIALKQPFLPVPPRCSKHLQAFSFVNKGQSCCTGPWAGASCKSISLTSSLLKKLDIRALTTANSLLSLLPEKWIILMLTEGFSFFKSCQI